MASECLGDQSIARRNAGLVPAPLWELYDFKRSLTRINHRLEAIYVDVNRLNAEGVDPDLASLIL
jgi:hypothetical protein